MDLRQPAVRHQRDAAAVPDMAGVAGIAVEWGLVGNVLEPGRKVHVVQHPFEGGVEIASRRIDLAGLVHDVGAVFVVP